MEIVRESKPVLKIVARACESFRRHRGDDRK